MRNFLSKYVWFELSRLTCILDSDLIWAISSRSKFADNTEKDRIVAGLRWLGMFSDEKITPRGNPLDTLCATLKEKMQYGPKERDMVMLQHKFKIKHKDGRKVYVPCLHLGNRSPLTFRHNNIIT